MSVPAPIDPRARIGMARLPVRELLGTALAGLSTRRLRAALSALGIAIGIGAMVAVVGVSSSTQANLLAELDALGTNLLTVIPGQTFAGNNEVLPPTARAMIARMQHVDSDVAVYQVPNAAVYRTPLVPLDQTGGIGVEAAGKALPQVLSVGLASGHFLGAVADRYPEAVLGAQAAQVLQMTAVGGHTLVYLGRTWFNVIGVLRPVLLDSTLDAQVYISPPVAERMFHVKANPSEIYLRASVNEVRGVSRLLAPTADPQHPDGVNVSRPSDALEARAAAKGQFTTLLLGLGGVALLVGAIGIINIMVISVLERRGEIGLRRALGATRRQISVQFLTESAMLAAIGGVCGLVLGIGATQVYALTRHEPLVVPLYVVITAPAAGFVLGVIAGIYPAAKAARLSPTEALRT